jgi:ketosteroid isomerase-like protein
VEVVRTVVNSALLALVVAGCGRPPEQPAPASAGDAVIACIRAYDAAWNARDTARVAAILATDYVYFSSRGRVSDRVRTLAVLANPAYLLQQAERLDFEVRLTGSTAVVSSRWRGRGTYEGRQFVDDQRCSMVLALVNSQWRLASEHCTQIVQ